MPGLHPSFQLDQAPTVAARQARLAGVADWPCDVSPDALRAAAGIVHGLAPCWRRLCREPRRDRVDWIVRAAAPVLATVLLVRRQPATRGLPGLISGLGVPLLYVAYLNRAGPGTICTTVTGGQECDDEWSPWPWLAVGVILLALGAAVFVRRQRRASLRS